MPLSNHSWKTEIDIWQDPSLLLPGKISMTKYRLTPVINNVRPITHSAHGPLLPAPRSEEAQHGMKAIFKIHFCICLSERGTTGQGSGKGFPSALLLLGVMSTTPHNLRQEPRCYCNHSLHLCFMNILNYRTGVAMLLGLGNQHRNPVYLPGGVFCPHGSGHLIGMGWCSPTVGAGGHGGVQRDVAGTRHTQASAHLQEGTKAPCLQPLL